jgi:hypothetical protein
LLVGTFVDDDGKTQKKVNKWNLVFDFTKNSDGHDNFKLISKSAFKINYVEDLLDQSYYADTALVNGRGNWLFELPKEFGG